MQGALHSNRYLGDDDERKKRKLRKYVGTLYVHRPVLNGDEIIAWFKAQGFKTLLPPDDMHVTIAFSRSPVDWNALPSDNDKLIVPAGTVRSVAQFDGGAVVLRISSPELSKRWNQFRNIGASWDFPDYHPHVTLSYQAGDVGIATVRPYMGPVVLGPECWGEVQDDWKEGIVEKALVGCSVSWEKPVTREQVRKHAQALAERISHSPSWKDDIMQKIGARNNRNDLAMIQQIRDLAVKLGADDGSDEPDADDDTGDQTDVEKSAGQFRIAKVDDSLGLVFGYAMICKVDGEPYYDLNIDPDGSRVPEHIPEATMLKCAADFMQTARAGNVMHKGDDTGTFVFAFPLTTDIAKAMGISSKVTGLMVAYKPSPEVLAKFKDGTYTGFSIEGSRLAVKEVE